MIEIVDFSQGIAESLRENLYFYRLPCITPHLEIMADQTARVEFFAQAFCSPLRKKLLPRVWSQRNHSNRRFMNRNVRNYRNGLKLGLQFVNCQPVCKTKKDQSTISTPRLNTLLCVHLAPINVVVYHESIGKSYLEGGFTLICFQRLSRPNLATRPCRRRDNRYTRGSFTPVLSY